MQQWATIDIADALELLSPDFKNEEVRRGTQPAVCVWPDGLLSGVPPWQCVWPDGPPWQWCAPLWCAPLAVPPWLCVWPDGLLSGVPPWQTSAVQ